MASGVTKPAAPPAPQNSPSEPAVHVDSKGPTARSCRPRRRPGRQKEGASAGQTAGGRQPLLCPSRLPPDRPQARFAALGNGTASGLPHSVRRKPHLGEGGALRSHRPPHEPVGGTSLLKQGEPSRWASTALTAWAVPLAVTQGGTSGQTGSAQSLRGPDILARPGLLSSLPPPPVPGSPEALKRRDSRASTLQTASSPRLQPRLAPSSPGHLRAGPAHPRSGIGGAPGVPLSSPGSPCPTRPGCLSPSAGTRFRIYIH